MAWGELKSPRPPRFPSQRRNGDRSVSTLDPADRARVERTLMASHADSAKHEAAGARRIALDLGDETVAAHFAMAMTALQDGLAALTEHSVD